MHELFRVLRLHGELRQWLQRQLQRRLQRHLRGDKPRGYHPLANSLQGIDLRHRSATGG